MLLVASCATKDRLDTTDITFADRKGFKILDSTSPALQVALLGFRFPQWFVLSPRLVVLSSALMESGWDRGVLSVRIMSSSKHHGSLCSCRDRVPLMFCCRQSCYRVLTALVSAGRIRKQAYQPGFSPVRRDRGRPWGRSYLDSYQSCETHRLDPYVGWLARCSKIPLARPKVSISRRFPTWRSSFGREAKPRTASFDPLLKLHLLVT